MFDAKLLDKAKRIATLVQDIEKNYDELVKLFGHPLLVPSKVNGEAPPVKEGKGTLYRCPQGHVTRSTKRKMDALCGTCGDIHVEPLQQSSTDQGKRPCGCGPLGRHRRECAEFKK